MASPTASPRLKLRTGAGSGDDGKRMCGDSRWRLGHLLAARVLIRINLIGIGQSSHARKSNNSLKGPNEALATGDDISREEQKMMCRAVRLMPLIAAISFWSVLGPTARAEEDDTAALAAALKTAKATLQDGLRASKARGTPISAKFEIEDGKLQLSIYTMKGNDFIEVVADPKAGAIAYAQEITDAMDLNEAIEQQAAVAKAKVPLLAAADTAVNENAGSRAVSIVPELTNGQATAEVTLLTGNTFKKVTEKLD